MTVAREIDPLLEQRCLAYQLQARPHSASLHALSTLQDQIDALSPRALFRIPTASLHFTILPLIDVAEAPRLSAPVADLWRMHGKAWIQAIGQTCAAMPGFSLQPTEIRYTDRAVILLTGMPNPIETIRQLLAKDCSLPQRRARVPAITHVTLFRYLRPDLVTEQDCAHMLPEDVIIDQIQLVRENIYPSLDVTVIEDWDLRTRIP